MDCCSARLAKASETDLLLKSWAGSTAKSTWSVWKCWSASALERLPEPENTSIVTGPMLCVRKFSCKPLRLEDPVSPIQSVPPCLCETRVGGLFRRSSSGSESVISVTALSSMAWGYASDLRLEPKWKKCHDCFPILLSSQVLSGSKYTWQMFSSWRKSNIELLDITISGIWPKILPYWVNEWVWMGEWMDERTNDRTHEWVNDIDRSIDCMTEWMHTCMEGWMNERMDE